MRQATLNRLLTLTPLAIAPDIHLDASGNRRKKNCEKGVSCGGSCIEAADTCRVNTGGIATRSELREISKLSSRIRSVASASKAPTQESDYLENRSIRDLRSLAAERKIYRYGSMTQEQLKSAIRAIDKDPKLQERLMSDRNRARERRAAAKQLAPKNALDAYKELRRVTKLFGSNPEAAGLFAASLVLGASAATVNRLRDRYKSGLEDSARMAYQRSQGVSTQQTGKENILFAVGGFKGDGSTGQRIKDVLTGKGDGTMGDKWFDKGNHIVAFDHSEFDIPKPGVSRETPSGKQNPAYTATVIKDGFGQYLKNFQRGRNEAAVDLASQVYAYGSRHPNKPINVLSHGAGGNLVNEATEILNRIRPQPGKAGALGSDITKRLNIVNLGSPYFGFANDEAWNRINHRTISSANDPMSFLPKRMTQWISSVKGGRVDDYLSNLDVKESLREAFGYYRNSSIAGLRDQERRRKQNKAAIAESVDTLNMFVPGSKFLYNAVDKVSGLAKENPTAAWLTGGAILTGSSVAGYRNLRSRYESNVKDAASQASAIADQVEVPKVGQKSNIAVVVGGAGMTSDEIITSLERKSGKGPKGGKIRGGSEKTEQWLRSNAVTGFDTTNNFPSNEVNTTEAVGNVATQVYGSRLTRVLNAGKSNDAIALAAKLWKLGSEDYARGKLPINVMAFGPDGQVAREALDILEQMPGGSAIAKRTQLASFGSPAFGLGKTKRETSFFGSDDPFGKLPFKRGSGLDRQVGGVRSHNASSYLNSTDAVEQAIDVFNQNANNRVKPKPEKRAEAYSGARSISEVDRKALYDFTDRNPVTDPGWDELTPEEQQRRLRIYFKAYREGARTAPEAAKARQKFVKNSQSSEPGQTSNNSQSRRKKRRRS